jgi:transcriptional regulator with XRE-family HTH domain
MRDKGEPHDPSRPDRVAEPLATYTARRSSPTARRTRERTPPRPPSSALPPGGRGERMAARCEFARRAFPSDAEMARVLGVDRSRMSRWRQGEPPDQANAERLLALDTVVELLTGYLDERSIPKWLYGINAQLRDRRPIDVIVSGRLSEVVAAIEAEKSGAYA